MRQQRLTVGVGHLHGDGRIGSGRRDHETAEGRRALEPDGQRRAGRPDDRDERRFLEQRRVDHLHGIHQHSGQRARIAHGVERAAAELGDVLERLVVRVVTDCDRGDPYAVGDHRVDEVVELGRVRAAVAQAYDELLLRVDAAEHAVCRLQRRLQVGAAVGGDRADPFGDPPRVVVALQFDVHVREEVEGHHADKSLPPQ